MHCRLFQLIDRPSGLVRTIVLLCLWAAPNRAVQADVIELKNGMEIHGTNAPVAGIGTDVLAPAASGNVDVKLVVVIDDGLRRTFVSKNQIANLRQEVAAPEKIRLKQKVAKRGPPRLGNIGAIVGVQPFDDWGRRIFSMLSPKGRMNVVQGITEITPDYIRVQGLLSKKPYIWDMRIATSSVAPERLRTIIGKHLDLDDPDVRLSIVRLYLQSERYSQGEQELRGAIQQFPDLNRLKQQLKELHQLKSRQQLKEIQLRQKAGQHRLAETFLKKFPDSDVAGEILLEVSELLEEYEQQAAQGKSILDSIASQIPSIQSAKRRETFELFHDELTAELSFNTLPRLADFVRLRLDEKLDHEQKLALAISGWLLGGTGTENIAVATSLWRVREIVTLYLRAHSTEERERLMGELTSLEGGSPTYVAKILNTMKPPKLTKGLDDRYLSADDLARSKNAQQYAPQDVASDVVEKIDDTHFRVTIPGIQESDRITYDVQLPPEYDANRRYPTIVTLHAAGSSPKMQIDWWAGAFDEQQQTRLGQATRHGYIVVAPRWGRHRQTKYDYSAAEHAAILYSLRNASQRFSIDSDRVFLSGHSMGADAAWDIGLAHPDLWAGVIPIGGVAEYGNDSPKYVSRYWGNASQVAFYFVGGALDAKKIGLNSRDWNRYLKATGFDTMVVEYRGRGHEHFQDEIQRLFRWMNLHRRDFFPREIKVSTMRPWDNFFWWIEVNGLPKKSITLPAAWPTKAGRPAIIKADVREKKNVFLKVGTAEATVWLSPEIVDLDGKVTIYTNGKSPPIDIHADVRVLLEDARRRGDRQHPFWAKVEVRTGRRRR